MGKISDRMIQDLRMRGLSPLTEKSYLLACSRFVVHHHGRSPAEMGLEEVRAYLAALAQRGASPSVRNGAASGIAFLYRVTLDRPEVAARIPRVRVPKKLPDILSGTEVEQVLAAVHPLRARVILSLAYGSGLRVRECCRLQVADIDSRRMQIHVRQGKGFKDRYVMLSERLLKLLREYWAAVRPTGPDLFPGRGMDGLVCSEAVTKALAVSLRGLGLTKRVTPHTFRHTFATHLLEVGTDLRVIQSLLGHASPSTTVRYTRLTARHLGRVRSPLDLLGTEEGARLG